MPNAGGIAPGRVLSSRYRRVTRPLPSVVTPCHVPREALLIPLVVVVVQCAPPVAAWSANQRRSVVLLRRGREHRDAEAGDCQQEHAEPVSVSHPEHGLTAAVPGVPERAS